MMAEDLLLTNSQEVELLMANDMNIYLALLQNNSLEQNLDYPQDYDENLALLHTPTQDDSQLKQEHHVPQLLQQDVAQLYEPQTRNNYVVQNNHFNNTPLQSYAHPSNSPPNLNHHLPVSINNYLPPINYSSQQINEVKKPPILSLEDYAGPHNFNVYFNPLTIRNPWMYSPSLEKLFITMGDSFPVDFKRTGDVKDLFIRATTLYVSPQLNQEMVVRCLSHSSIIERYNSDVPESIISHVLRCQDANSAYQGNVKDKQHLSVVVPLGLPQPGTDVFRVIYFFVCKNSCPTGINRRPTCVVFTLEDKFGNVLGRRRINVRVCSCPKRDKEKEEKDAISAPQPRNKKRRLVKVEKKESSDESAPSDIEISAIKEQKLTITIYGHENKMLLLHAACDRFRGELHRRGPNENLKKSLVELEKLIKTLEE